LHKDKLPTKPGNNEATCPADDARQPSKLVMPALKDKAIRHELLAANKLVDIYEH
jgi:hypothetical protein